MQPALAPNLLILLGKFADNVVDSRQARLGTATQKIRKLLEQHLETNIHGEALLQVLTLCKKTLPSQNIDINIVGNLAVATMQKLPLHGDKFNPDIAMQAQAEILAMISFLTNNPRKVRSIDLAEQIIAAGIEAYGQISKTRPLLASVGSAHSAYSLYQYDKRLGERLFFALSAIDKLESEALLKKHLEADSLLAGALKKVRHSIAIGEKSPDTEAHDLSLAKAKLAQYYITTNHIEEAYRVAATISDPNRLVVTAKRLAQINQLTPYKIGLLFDERKRPSSDVPQTDLLLAAMNYCATISHSNTLEIISTMAGSKVWGNIWQLVQGIASSKDLDLPWNTINDFTDDILERLRLQAAVQTLFDEHDSPLSEGWFARRTLEFHKILGHLRNNELIPSRESFRDDDPNYLVVYTTYKLKLVEALAEIALQAPDSSAQARRYHKLLVSLPPDLQGFLYAASLESPPVDTEDPTRLEEWRTIYAQKITVLLKDPTHTATATAVLAKIASLFDNHYGNHGKTLLRALDQFATLNPDFAPALALMRTKLNIASSD